MSGGGVARVHRFTSPSLIHTVQSHLGLMYSSRADVWFGAVGGNWIKWRNATQAHKI